MNGPLSSFPWLCFSCSIFLGYFLHKYKTESQFNFKFPILSLPHGIDNSILMELFKHCISLQYMQIKPTITSELVWFPSVVTMMRSACIFCFLCCSVPLTWSHDVVLENMLTVSVCSRYSIGVCLFIFYIKCVGPPVFDGRKKRRLLAQCDVLEASHHCAL